MFIRWLLFDVVLYPVGPRLVAGGIPAPVVLLEQGRNGARHRQRDEILACPDHCGHFGYFVLGNVRKVRL